MSQTFLVFQLCECRTVLRGYVYIKLQILCKKKSHRLTGMHCHPSQQALYYTCYTRLGLNYVCIHCQTIFILKAARKQSLSLSLSFSLRANYFSSCLQPTVSVICLCNDLCKMCMQSLVHSMCLRMLSTKPSQKPEVYTQNSDAHTRDLPFRPDSNTIFPVQLMDGDQTEPVSPKLHLWSQTEL